MSHSTTRLTVDDVIERVSIMRHQEETSYCYQNYFPRREDGSLDNQLNVTWREKICQWSYNVVDHFDLSREVVAVSMNLFDRYLATKGNKCNGNLALLTSLTTLHLAIKLHDTKKIKLATLANLSRGQFCAKDIEEMEWEILGALGWKLHPPTQYTFISLILLFLPHEVNSSVRRELLELSRYLIELAVCESNFVHVKNSTIAYASILNVMEDINYARLSAGLRETFLREVSHKLGFSPYARPVMEVRDRLRVTFASSCDLHNISMIFHQNNNNHHHPQAALDANNDSSSLAGGSISSTGSGSRSGYSNRAGRSRTNSIDSAMGSCRYSPSPRRLYVAASPSAAAGATSRAHHSFSPMVAGVQ